MIRIRHIQPDEWTIAKRLIYRVAHEIFNSRRPLEEVIELYESNGELHDMDDIQKNYFENRGIFLVTTDDDRIIGTGAVRYFEDGIGEIRRLWLLPDYHHQGLGYRMMKELLAFAREQGYQHIRLETDPVHQRRAVEFYRQLGFVDIPMPDASPDEDIVMEMDL